MKKIVFLSLFALCLPWTLVAQSIDDDLYYTPSKNKEEKKEEQKTATRDSSIPAPTPSKPAAENEKQSNTPTSENKSNPQ